MDKPTPGSGPPPTGKGSSTPTKRKRRVLCSRACSSCRRAHKACDDNRPCSRCVSRGLEAECIADSQQQQQQQQSSQSDKKRSRAKKPADTQSASKQRPKRKQRRAASQESDDLARDTEKHDQDGQKTSLPVTTSTSFPTYTPHSHSPQGLPSTQVQSQGLVSDVKSTMFGMLEEIKELGQQSDKNRMYDELSSSSSSSSTYHTLPQQQQQQQQQIVMDPFDDDRHFRINPQDLFSPPDYSGNSPWWGAQQHNKDNEFYKYEQAPDHSDHNPLQYTQSNVQLLPKTTSTTQTQTQTPSIITAMTNNAFFGHHHHSMQNVNIAQRWQNQRRRAISQNNPMIDIDRDLQRSFNYNTFQRMADASPFSSAIPHPDAAYIPVLPYMQDSINVNINGPVPFVVSDPEQPFVITKILKPGADLPILAVNPSFAELLGYSVVPKLPLLLLAIT